MKSTFVGRPPKFRTVEELENKIEEYFATGHRTKEVKIGNKRAGYEMVNMPMITITDLILFLGFVDRHSFYDYENRNDGFSHAIKRARTFIEREYEEKLQENPVGAIFALKNFGWKDKTETDITSNGNELTGLVSINPPKPKKD